MDSLAKAPLSYWQRHMRLVFKYGSFRKNANLLQAYYHWLKGSSKIPTMPAFLKVEISRHCMVKCKYCYIKKEKVFYPFVQYQKLIDRLKDYIFMVSLYDIGEPLENEDVIEYIKYAHMKKVGTVISSSLSINKTDEFWKELVLSGIDHIIVSIDGTSEEVYKKYKTNGNLNLVLSNLEKILYYKAMYAKKVFIEWQMIDLPWNKEEQGTAKKIAGDMGCDKFRLIREAMWSRLKYRQQRYIRNHNCLLPYIIFIVTAYNKVRPCYKIYNEPMIIGDLDDHTFDEIWNSDEIATIRDKKRIRDRIGCRTCRE